MFHTSMWPPSKLEPFPHLSSSSPSSTSLILHDKSSERMAASAPCMVNHNPHLCLPPTAHTSTMSPHQCLQCSLKSTGAWNLNGREDTWHKLWMNTCRLRSALSRCRLLLSLAFCRAWYSWCCSSSRAFFRWAAAWAMTSLCYQCLSQRHSFYKVLEIHCDVDELPLLFAMKPN